MANNTATVRVSLSHPAPGGGTATPPSIVVSAPYEAQLAGDIDIPDTTADATEFELPLGSIGTEITGLIIKNDNNAAIGIRLNSAVGDADIYSLAAGGVFVHAAPTDDDAPITAAAITTTAEQSGNGRVAFWLFGDPSAEE